jgi:phage shock protein A
MFRATRRLRTRLGDRTAGLRRRADPEVRLERAIQVAHDQHRQLQDQAAELHDERQEVEERLRAVTDEQRDLATKTQAASQGAEDATARGDVLEASELSAAAASFASRLAAVERELASLQESVDRVASASDDATASAVQQAWVLQEQLAEGHRRLEEQAQPEDSS